MTSPSLTFVDSITKPKSVWFQPVNDVVYKILGDAGFNAPTTVAQLLANIGVYSKTQVNSLTWEWSAITGTPTNLTSYGVSSTDPVIVAAISNALPPGTVVDFAGETPPTGWLECDGSSLLRASYSALFAAIGTLHGAADSLHFNLPDHRGKFKRGWAHGTANDPDAATRTAAATGGATGDHVGTAQGWQNAAHTHQFVASSGVGGTNQISSTTGQAPGLVTTSSSGGNQANPINAAVMSIIKHQ